jgi:hypothetical protein
MAETKVPVDTWQTWRRNLVRGDNSATSNEHGRRENHTASLVNPSELMAWKTCSTVDQARNDTLNSRSSFTENLTQHYLIAQQHKEHVSLATKDFLPQKFQ